MVDVPSVGVSERLASTPNVGQKTPPESVLRDLAEKFETAFLTEMLRHSGLGKMPNGFNGGAGEARYSGFLIEAYAGELSQSGQIGLADQIYQDLVARGTQ